MCGHPALRCHCVGWWCVVAAAAGGGLAPQMVSAGAGAPDHLHCSGHQPAALQHCSTPWIGWAEYQTVIAKTAQIYLDAYTLYIYKVLFCIITNQIKYLNCSKIFIDK